MEIERSYPDIAAMLVMVEKRRESGYTFNDRLLVPGMSAAAVPIRGKEGRPVAALRISTIESRVQDERQTEIVRWLTEQATTLEARLNGTTGGLTEASIRVLTRNGR
ncbi:MAG: hypothetical protein M3518_00945 [Actinomycetota bacterium]|nr:hypothetical protein [Actinomycetota bacterium]